MFGALVCITFCWLGRKAATPFVTADRWREANDAVEQEVHRWHIRNQRDELEIKVMDTPQGIEQAARRLGYIRPGEHPLRIPDAGKE